MGDRPMTDPLVWAAAILLAGLIIAALLDL